MRRAPKVQKFSTLSGPGLMGCYLIIFDRVCRWIFPEKSTTLVIKKCSQTHILEVALSWRWKSLKNWVLDKYPHLLNLRECAQLFHADCKLVWDFIICHLIPAGASTLLILVYSNVTFENSDGGLEFSTRWLTVSKVAAWDFTKWHYWNVLSQLNL